MRIVIFGVDGLTFRILHPLIARGALPNFRRLSEQGSEVILESKFPPVTPVAWVSLYTGLKPAQHGVYDFWTYEQPTRKARVVTNRKGGKAIWNILSEYGKRVLVINVPMTYPPEPVNGIMVSGYMTPSASVSFTYPGSFKDELYKIVPDYRIDLESEDMLSVEMEGKVDRLIDATLYMTERRIELTNYLLKTQLWDFCMVTFVGADRLQHPLWDDLSSLEGRALEYFHLLDHGLGLILEQLEAQDCLFVVSDHGFQGASRSFEINEYLYKKNLLGLGANIRQTRNQARRISYLKHTINRIGLLTLTRRVARGVKTVAAMREKFDDVHEPIMADFDWEHTWAYVPSHSSFPGGYADIFLRQDLEEERLAALCDDLKRQIDPQSGNPLLSALYTTEVFGSGPYALCEPHLLLLPHDGITFRSSMGNKYLWDDARVRHDPRMRCGVHHKDGVLYAYGHGIKQGFTGPNAEIYDVVPTVLHCMGLPIVDEFDGSIIEKLFIEDKQPLPNALKRGATTNEFVQRRLKKD